MEIIRATKSVKHNQRKGTGLHVHTFALITHHGKSTNIILTKLR